jgi:hypothetical protein
VKESTEINAWSRIIDTMPRGIALHTIDGPPIPCQCVIQTAVFETDLRVGTSKRDN